MSTARPSVVQVVLEVGGGGLETMCADLAIELAQRGVRSSVIGLDQGGQLEERLSSGGVEFVDLGGRQMTNPAFHRRVAAAFRRLSPDAVHSHGFAPLLYSVVARWFAGAPRLVHTEHSIEYLRERRDYRRTLRWLARATSSFVVLGERMRRYYADDIGIAPRRLRIIPNGVALPPAVTAAQRQAARESLGLGNGYLVATVGRLAQVKNYPMLIAAFAGATAGDREAKLVLVGDGQERAKLQEHATDLGIGDRVHFLGWRTDVSQLLAAFDVFAMSSFSEGLPMAMLEAMSAGLAVLSTRVGDIPDVVIDGRTGRLTPSEDAAAMAGVLSELRAAPDERARLGAAARALVVDRYSRAAMVDAYLAAYGLTSPATVSA
ncbi:MAG: glycosyltransferase [Gemmatimonadaceae bacterium]